MWLFLPVWIDSDKVHEAAENNCRRLLNNRQNNQINARPAVTHKGWNGTRADHQKLASCMQYICPMTICIIYSSAEQPLMCRSTYSVYKVFLQRWEFEHGHTLWLDVCQTVQPKISEGVMRFLCLKIPCMWPVAPTEHLIFHYILTHGEVYSGYYSLHFNTSFWFYYKWPQKSQFLKYAFSNALFIDISTLTTNTKQTIDPQ